jgi:thiol-disulfide isomerase/thioredoxin
MTMSRCTALALLLVFAGSALAESASQATFPREWFFGNDEQRARHDELVGKPAPAVLDDLAGWYNGEVKAADLEKKIYVVGFWATWCGPCIASIPTINKLQADFAEQGVAVVAICGSANGQERMATVAKEREMKYPTARDVQQTAARTWRVMWWPTYAVVDRHGIVRAVGLRPNRIQDVIKIILEEQPAESKEESA